MADLGISIISGYNAQFDAIVDRTSSECQIPTGTSLVSLPTFDVPDPIVSCNNILDTTVVPTPFYCIPTVNGGLVFNSCNANTLAVTRNDVSIAPVPNSCDYQLTGEVDICLTACIPTITSNITVNSGNIPPSTSLQLVDSGDCDRILQGTFNVCTPTFTGGLSVNTGNIRSAGTLNLVPDGGCGAALTGSIDICTGVFSSSLNVVNVPYPQIANSIITFGPDGECGAKLSGEIQIPTPCVPEFIGSVNVQTGNNPGGTIALSPFGSCGAKLSGTITVPPNPQNAISSIDDSIPGTGACGVSGNDYLHLKLDNGVLSLAGQIVAPCFQCENTSGGDPFTFQDLELRNLSISQLNFQNSCCSNGSSGWTNCGNTLTIDGDNGKIILENGEVSINQTSYGDSNIQMDNKDLNVQNITFIGQDGGMWNMNVIGDTQQEQSDISSLVNLLTTDNNFQQAIQNIIASLSWSAQCNGDGTITIQASPS